MEFVTYAAAACGVLAGAVAGFLLGRRLGRRHPENGPDWKLRLKARDDDVNAAERRAADATVRLEALETELAGARSRLSELERGGTAPPAALTPSPDAAPGDDLTLVPGLGPDDAALLAASGITSFEALAGLGGSAAAVPESVADQLADRLTEWAAEARRLALRRSR